MASSDDIELQIDRLDHKKDSISCSSLLPPTIPQTIVTQGTTSSTLQNRLHNVSSSSSNMNDVVNFLSVLPTASRQFSMHSDGIIDVRSINYFRFHSMRRIALWCCIISFLLDIGLGLTAFINCVRSKSFLGFSYSVDTLMDSLCTGFVSWHLMTPSIADMRRRDRLVCCVIGALFIGSCLAIETRAIQSMILAKSVRPDLVVFSYSLIHVIIFTILSVIKIFLSKQIKSAALMADALNSIIGLIMIFPLLFLNRVTFLNKFAHLNDLVQVLMALVLFASGWKLILNSITKMNAEYARNLCESKLQKMVKEYNEAIDTKLQAFDVADNSHLSIVPISGSRRFSVISHIQKQ